MSPNITRDGRTRSWQHQFDSLHLHFYVFNALKSRNPLESVNSTGSFSVLMPTFQPTDYSAFLLVRVRSLISSVRPSMEVRKIEKRHFENEHKVCDAWKDVDESKSRSLEITFHYAISNALLKSCNANRCPRSKPVIKPVFKILQTPAESKPRRPKSNQQRKSTAQFPNLTTPAFATSKKSPSYKHNHSPFSESPWIPVYP